MLYFSHVKFPFHGHLSYIDTLKNQKMSCFKDLKICPRKIKFNFRGQTGDKMLILANLNRLAISFNIIYLYTDKSGFMKKVFITVLLLLSVISISGINSGLPC